MRRAFPHCVIEEKAKKSRIFLVRTENTFFTTQCERTNILFVCLFVCDSVSLENLRFYADLKKEEEKSKRISRAIALKASGARRREKERKIFGKERKQKTFF